MEIANLAKRIENSIDYVLNEKNYKHIIFKGNNLIRFDVLNRISVFMQNDSAFDIKTEEEWLMIGRKIIDYKNPIWIIMPMYNTKYIDNETKEITDISGLSSDELRKALEHNIVSKTVSIESLYCKATFDIRQTSQIEDQKFEVNKPNIKKSELIRVTKCILNASIVKNDKTYYDKESNTIYLCNDKYNNTVSTLVKCIIEYFTEKSKLMDICTKNDIDFNTIDDRLLILLRDTLEYSLCTLFSVNTDIDFAYVNGINSNDKVNIITISDSITNNIINYIDFNDNHSKSDAIKSLDNIKKATALLNTMEANKIYNKMKGA